MMLSMPIVLALLFLGITLLTWLVIFGSTKLMASYKNNFTESASTNLSQMFLFIDEKKLFAINIIAIILVPIIIFIVFDLLFYAVLAGICVLVLPKFMYRLLKKRRIAEFDAVLPDSIAQIAGAMRAGATLPMAMEVMVQETKGPISQEFSLLLREHRVGVTIDEAFENLGERVASADLQLVITASRIAREVGGNLAEIFERLASTMHEKATMEGKIKALTSQGKLQGWIVGMLPVGMVLVLFQMEPRSMEPLISSVFGWGVIAIFVLLELVGMFVIQKIVSIDV